MDLIQAAESGNIERVRELLDRGADINSQDDYGLRLRLRVGYANTALIFASYQGHTEIVKLLLDRGADPNIQNDKGYTALKLTEYGNIDIIESLLNRDADPNIQTDDGDTPLMFASLEDHIETVQLLLSRGADPNIRDRNGETALMQASENGNIEIVKLLLDNDADPNIQNRNGNTALMMAENDGYDDTATLIRDHMKLQKARQDLALATIFISRLRYDTPLKYLDESNIIEKITSKPRRYEPNIQIRMRNEQRRDKLTKARQRLASMRSMHSREGPIGSVRYDPSIMEGIGRHLSTMRPNTIAQRSMRLEDENDRIADYLNTLRQYGPNRGGSKRSKRKYRRYR